MFEHQGLDGSTNGLGYAEGLLATLASQQDDEFLAPIAPDEPGPLHDDPVQGSRHHGEASVAGQMAVSIVKALKKIDVDQDRREGVPPFRPVEPNIVAAFHRCNADWPDP